MPKSVMVMRSQNLNLCFEIFLFSDETDVVSHYFMRKEKRKGLLAVFNGIKESVLPTRTKKAF